MARPTNTTLAKLPEDKLIYRVRQTRSLIWPANISARNRLFADAGALVDLSHPILQKIFASQLALKAERVYELPPTAVVRGMDGLPMGVTMRIRAHDERANRPPAEDELAEALGIEERDLPDIDRPDRIAKAREKLRKDVRGELEAQIRAEVVAEMEAKAKEQADALREAIRAEVRAELEAEYEFEDDVEGEDASSAEAEADADLPSAKPTGKTKKGSSPRTNR